MITNRRLFLCGQLEPARRPDQIGVSEFSLWMIQFVVVPVFAFAIEGKAAVRASKP
jgi:hypothetical protein